MNYKYREPLELLVSGLGMIAYGSMCVIGAPVLLVSYLLAERRSQNETD